MLGTSRETKPQHGQGAATETQADHPIEAGAEVVHDLADYLSQAFPADAAEQATRASAHNIQAVTDAGVALAQRLQDLQGEWMAMAQGHLQRNLDALNQLVSCRTPQDLFQLQSDLARDSLKGVLAGTRMMARTMLRAVNEAARTIAFEAETVDVGNDRHAVEVSRSDSGQSRRQA